MSMLLSFVTLVVRQKLFICPGILKFCRLSLLEFCRFWASQFLYFMDSSAKCSRGSSPSLFLKEILNNDTNVHRGIWKHLIIDRGKNQLFNTDVGTKKYYVAARWKIISFRYIIKIKNEISTSSKPVESAEGSFTFIDFF